MSNWLGRMRRLAGRDDQKIAAEAERKRVDDAFRACGVVQPKFRAEMAERTTADDAIVLGHVVGACDVPIALRVNEIVGGGHFLTIGSTGCGKTTLAAGIALQLLRFGHRNLVVADMKEDLVARVREGLPAILDVMTPAAAHALVDSLVVIAPFSNSFGVRFDILETGGAQPEAVAHDIAGIVDRLGGAPLGVRQDALAYHLILAAIYAKLPFTALPIFLSDLDRFEAFAQNSPSEEVRRYAATRLRTERNAAAGLAARVDRILRVPGLRRMLGGKGAIDFHDLLRDKTVLIDLGGVPLGDEFAAYFVGQVILLRLLRGAFQRSAAEAARPVLVMVDEWAEWLSAGSDLANAFERSLALLRSRGVFLFLMAQSLATAERISTTLVRGVKANCNFNLLFRTDPESARAMSHVLPVTGRKLRAAPLPWEARSGSAVLSGGEELSALVQECVSLPDREAFFADRRTPHRSHRFRTATIANETPAFVATSMREALSRGSLGVPVGVLDAEGKARLAAIAGTIATPNELPILVPADRPAGRGVRLG